MDKTPVPFLFPFVRPDERGRPCVYGSGILLQIGARRLLASAAHVFDENTTIHFADGLVSTPGHMDIHLTPAPNGNRKNDKIDLGVTSLPDELANRLISQKYQFLKAGYFDVDDIPTPSKKYLFTGFPASQQHRFNFPDQVVHLKPMEYALYSIPSEELAAAGWNSHLHLGGVFDRNNMLDKARGRITAPEPLGMSGGGVWVLKDSKYYLVGIGIEWDETRKMLVGIRIGALVLMIKRRFPDTIPYIRESQWIA